MSDNRYARYIIREPRMKTPHAAITAPIAAFIRGGVYFPKVQSSINWELIERSFVVEKSGHNHDWDQLRCFTGTNPHDFFDFGAETEFFMSEEAERYFIKYHHSDFCSQRNQSWAFGVYQNS